MRRLTRVPRVLFLSALLPLAASCAVGDRVTNGDLDATAVADERIDDASITKAIQREVRSSAATRGADVGVNVADGVVELTGSVSDLLAKESASMAAERTRGVREVNNQLSVRVAARPDQEIKRDVEERLRREPAFEGYPLQVGVHAQRVTLAGEVDSYRQGQLAGHSVRSVKGVRGIDNELTLAFLDGRKDAAIVNGVRHALRWDALVDAEQVKVIVNDGVVRLSGTVGSAVEKPRAISDAWVGGVREVHADDLSVAWDVDRVELRGEVHSDLTDQAIAAALEVAFAADPRVSADGLDARVSDGIATLTGMADDIRARGVAEHIASNTVGVSRVDNRIDIRVDDERSDMVLEREIERALGWNLLTEAFEIGVDVNNGVATLTGTVNGYRDKAAATDEAAGVSGVQRVQSRIEVRDRYSYIADPFANDWFPDDYMFNEYVSSSSMKSDEQLEDDVLSELFWSPFVDSDEITVRIDDGVAYLSGEADTWGERNAAIRNAYEAGAVRVDDQLTVRYRR